MLTNNKGFTLIEVITALLILSIGILAMQSMQYSSVTTNFAAINITRAIGQGTDTTERILALTYNDSLLDAGSHDETEFPSEWEHIKHTAIDWQVTDDEPMPNMKTIQITITSSEKGKDKTIPITYYKAEIL